MLDKAAILAADHQHVLLIDVPEWGGQVGLRHMSGRERDRFDALVYKNQQDNTLLDNIRTTLLLYTLCDMQGERLFADDERGAVEGLDSVVTERLFEQAQQHNGMGIEAVDDAKKNSSDARNDGAGLPLPNISA